MDGKRRSRTAKWFKKFEQSIWSPWSRNARVQGAKQKEERQPRNGVRSAGRYLFVALLCPAMDKCVCVRNRLPPGWEVSSQEDFPKVNA